MQQSTIFYRVVMPAIAFQAVMIAGGYATGRELVEFFLSSGARSGLAGLAVASLVFSAVCAATFAFAHLTRSYDYKSLIRELLGPLWIVFELVYLAALVLIVAVTGAGAAAVAETVSPGAGLVGSAFFVVLVAAVVAGGSTRVEALFKNFFFIRMAVYILFIALSLSRFGDRISENLATSPITTAGFTGGLIYAGYGLLAAVVVVPMVRHCQSPCDAVIAGALCGPVAMLPATLFYLAMCAFPAELVRVEVPSDYLLQQLASPSMRLLYRVVMFVGLIESAVGLIHAINERVRDADALPGLRARFGATGTRLALALLLLFGSMIAADRIGLVALIARGYGSLAFIVVATFGAPILTIGVWKIVKLWRIDAVSRLAADPAIR